MGRVIERFPPCEALEGAVVDVVGEVEVPLDDAEGEVLDEPETDVLARPGAPSVSSNHLRGVYGSHVNERLTLSNR